MRKLSATIITLMSVLAFQAQAQNISGSISGRVVDQQGAAVPSASVTATEPTRNVSTAAKTSEQGDFVFAGLQPGTYSIRVEAAGKRDYGWDDQTD